MALRRDAERMAWKNDEEVWRRRDTGVQLRKVELERKFVKKAGQEAEVKLLPIEVSNGDGSGVVMTVIEGEESEDVEVGVSVSALEDSDVEDEDSAVEDVEGSEEVDVGSAASDEELVLSKRSCLRSSHLRGGGLVSTWISPLASNS